MHPVGQGLSAQHCIECFEGTSLARTVARIRVCEGQKTGKKEKDRENGTSNVLGFVCCLAFCSSVGRLVSMGRARGECGMNVLS